MRISDWSSDVCSSDLVADGADIDVADLQRVGGQRRSSSQGAAQRDGARCCGAAGQEMAARQVLEHASLLMVFVGCGLVELSCWPKRLAKASWSVEPPFQGPGGDSGPHQDGYRVGHGGDGKAT